MNYKYNDIILLTHLHVILFCLDKTTKHTDTYILKINVSIFSYCVITDKLHLLSYK